MLLRVIDITGLKQIFKKQKPKWVWLPYWLWDRLKSRSAGAKKQNRCEQEFGCAYIW